MKNLIFFALIASFGFISCQKPAESTPYVPETSDPVLKSAIVEQNNSFSVDIFKEIINNEEEQKNVFISPLSMYYALGMAGVGAAGETNQEFKNVLGWQNQSDTAILLAMKSLYNDISPENPGIAFEVANSLWQKQGFPIKEAYKEQVANYFEAKISELDFADPLSVEIINSWIEEKTHDRIKDMLDGIPSDAVLYLINAIYFKADWKYQFDEEENKTMSFVTSDNQLKDVQFMRQKGTFRYQTNDYCSSIALPYVDSSYSMVILLPHTQIGMSGLLANLTDSTYKEWEKAMSYKEVEVSLPKFSYEYGTKVINEELQHLGLNKAFEPSEADFSNISDFQIFISRVMHKAFIEVNEKGSEAAAATIVEFSWTSVGPENLAFIANHPFIFTIYHQPSKSILFMGKVAYPEQE